MAGRSAVHELVLKARRRLVQHLLAGQFVFAAAAALAASILLLLLGTRIFDWRWVAAIGVISLLWGAYRVLRRLPSPYSVAQFLDHRLNLSDLLSTALYFETNSGRKHTLDVIEKQRVMAEDAARQADWKTGTPFCVPRSLYVSAGLAVAAISLFVVRVGITRTMDLRPSLVKIAFDAVFGNEQLALNQKKPPAGNHVRNPASIDKTGGDPWQAENRDQQTSAEEALNQAEGTEINGQSAQADPKAGANTSKANTSKKDTDQPGDEPGGKDQPGQSPGNQNGKEQDGQPGQDPGDSASGQNASNSSSNPSLASKMRDAISNLLSKLKSQSGDQAQRNNSQSQPNGSQSGQQKNAEQGQRSEGENQASNSQTAQQGEQNGESAQKGNSTAQSNNGDRSPDHPKDGQSGAGREDGDKKARQAAQLAAMGKITELIGKRAANMTGQVMVEVAPQKQQQLKTQYTGEKAAHSEAGSDLNRDEVPLEYQPYVQHYFEELHKLAESQQKKNKSE